MSTRVLVVLGLDVVAYHFLTGFIESPVEVGVTLLVLRWTLGLVRIHGITLYWMSRSDAVT